MLNQEVMEVEEYNRSRFMLETLGDSTEDNPQASGPSLISAKLSHDNKHLR